MHAKSTPQDPPPSLVPPARDMFLSSEFLEAIPDAMVAVDHDGTILQVNSQTETLFGYRREELIGQRVEILVPSRRFRVRCGNQLEPGESGDRHAGAERDPRCDRPQEDRAGTAPRKPGADAPYHRRNRRLSRPPGRHH